MASLLTLFALLLLANSVWSMNKGYFWQLSDVHYDPTYTSSGAHLSCLSPKTSAAFRFGDFDCDSPKDLITSAIDYMKTISKTTKPDFVLWTGDNGPHIDDKNSYMNAKKIYDIIASITGQLKSLSTDIYPSIGNHDHYLTDQIPVNKGNSFYSKLTTDGKWDQLIPKDALNSFKQCGFYSFKLNANVVMISLNTVLYYSNNKLNKDVEDPCKQLRWLKKTLDDVKSNGDKAMIMGHIPPGTNARKDSKSSYRDNFNKEIYEILSKYSDVIGSAVFGHEHSDSFRMIYKDSKASFAMFISPSLTPYMKQNPAVRRYAYDKDSGELLSYTQYFMDLQASKRRGKAIWKVEYESADLYGSLDPKNMHKFAEKMRSGKDKSFSDYFNYFAVSYYTYSDSVCNEKCRNRHFCSATAVLNFPNKVCQNLKEIAKTLSVIIIVVIVIAVLVFLSCVCGCVYCLFCR